VPKSRGVFAVYVIIVEFNLSENSFKESLEMILLNAKTSLDKETGCHVFDVNVSGEVDNKVLLYEVYENEIAFEHHLSSNHFIDFDRKILPNVISKSVTAYFKRN